MPTPTPRIPLNPHPLTTCHSHPRYHPMRHAPQLQEALKGIVFKGNTMGLSWLNREGLALSFPPFMAAIKAADRLMPKTGGCLGQGRECRAAGRHK